MPFYFRYGSAINLTCDKPMEDRACPRLRIHREFVSNGCKTRQ